MNEILLLDGNKNTKQMIMKIPTLKKKSIVETNRKIADYLRSTIKEGIELKIETLVTLLSIPTKERCPMDLKKTINYFDEKSTLKLIKAEKGQELDSESIDECFAKHMEIQLLPANEILFYVNNIADKFYMVLKGNVKVLIPIKKKIQMTKNDFFKFLENLYNQREYNLIKIILNENYMNLFNNLKSNLLKFNSKNNSFEINKNITANLNNGNSTNNNTAYTLNNLKNKFDKKKTIKEEKTEEIKDISENSNESQIKKNNIINFDGFNMENLSPEIKAALGDGIGNKSTIIFEEIVKFFWMDLNKDKEDTNSNYNPTNSNNTNNIYNSNKMINPVLKIQEFESYEEFVKYYKIRYKKKLQEDINSIEKIDGLFHLYETEKNNFKKILDLNLNFDEINFFEKTITADNNLKNNYKKKKKNKSSKVNIKIHNNSNNMNSSFISVEFEDKINSEAKILRAIVSPNKKQRNVKIHRENNFDNFNNNNIYTSSKKLLNVNYLENSNKLNSNTNLYELENNSPHFKSPISRQNSGNRNDIPLSSFNKATNSINPKLTTTFISNQEKNNLEQEKNSINKFYKIGVSVSSSKSILNDLKNSTESAKDLDSFINLKNSTEKLQINEKLRQNALDLFCLSSNEKFLEQKYLFFEEKTKQIDYYIYEYIIKNLFEGSYFGDLALDSTKKKRTATVKGGDNDTILGFIPKEIYHNYIYIRNQQIAQSNLVFLNNLNIFQNIKSSYFQRHYYEFFKTTDYIKNQVVIEQNQDISSIYFIKSGKIDISLSANILEIQNYLKLIIQKLKKLKLIDDDEYEKYDNEFLKNFSFKDYENHKEKFDKLLIRKYVHLFSLSSGEIIAMEPFMLSTKAVYKAQVQSEKAKVFIIGGEHFKKIVKFYTQSMENFMNTSFNKTKVVLSRLNEIKMSYLKGIEDRFNDKNINHEYLINKTNKNKIENLNEETKIPNRQTLELNFYKKIIEFNQIEEQRKIEFKRLIRIRNKNNAVLNKKKLNITNKKNLFYSSVDKLIENKININNNENFNEENNLNKSLGEYNRNIPKIKSNSESLEKNKITDSRLASPFFKDKFNKTQIENLDKNIFDNKFQSNKKNLPNKNAKNNILSKVVEGFNLPVKKNKHANNSIFTVRPKHAHRTLTHSNNSHEYDLKIIEESEKNIFLNIENLTNQKDYNKFLNFLNSENNYDNNRFDSNISIYNNNLNKMSFSILGQNETKANNNIFEFNDKNLNIENFPENSNKNNISSNFNFKLKNNKHNNQIYNFSDTTKNNKIFPINTKYHYNYSYSSEKSTLLSENKFKNSESKFSEFNRITEKIGNNLTKQSMNFTIKDSKSENKTKFANNTGNLFFRTNNFSNINNNVISINKILPDYLGTNYKYCNNDNFKKSYVSKINVDLNNKEYDFKNIQAKLTEKTNENVQSENTNDLITYNQFTISQYKPMQTNSNEDNVSLKIPNIINNKIFDDQKENKFQENIDSNLNNIKNINYNLNKNSIEEESEKQFTEKGIKSFNKNIQNLKYKNELSISNLNNQKNYQMKNSKFDDNYLSNKKYNKSKENERLKSLKINQQHDKNLNSPLYTNNSCSFHIRSKSIEMVQDLNNNIKSQNINQSNNLLTTREGKNPNISEFEQNTILLNTFNNLKKSKINFGNFKNLNSNNNNFDYNENNQNLQNILNNSKFSNIYGTKSMNQSQITNFTKSNFKFLSTNIEKFNTEINKITIIPENKNNKEQIKFSYLHKNENENIYNFPIIHYENDDLIYQKNIYVKNLNDINLINYSVPKSRITTISNKNIDEIRNRFYGKKLKKIFNK